MRHCKGGPPESTVFQQRSNAPRKSLTEEVFIGCNIDQDRPKGGQANPEANLLPIVLRDGCLPHRQPPLLSGKVLTKRIAESQIRL